MNVLRQVLQLAPVLYPGSGHQTAIRRWKHVGRSVLYLPWTAEWFRFLDTPNLRVATAARPRVFAKLQRPYLTRRHRVPARLAALKQHYGYIDRTLPAATIDAIYRPGGLHLATFPLDEGRSVTIRLENNDRYEKEGEFIVGIYLSPGDKLAYTVTCVVTGGGDAGRGLFIGGLQGGNEPDQPDLIRDLTKDMFGLRPKAFALFLAQQLADWVGATGLRAVADDETIYQHFQNRKSIEASYDGLWTESGGQRSPADGCFDLPLRHVEKSREEIKTKKRSLYEKRYALMRDIAEATRTGWQAALRRPGG